MVSADLLGGACWSAAYHSMTCRWALRTCRKRLVVVGGRTVPFMILFLHGEGCDSVDVPDCLAYSAIKTYLPSPSDKSGKFPVNKVFSSFILPFDMRSVAPA